MNGSVTITVGSKSVTRTVPSLGLSRSKPAPVNTWRPKSESAPGPLERRGGECEGP